MLCENCRCELLQLAYPPSVNVGERLLTLDDGSTRRLRMREFEGLGILWPRRDGWLHVERLRQLYYGQRDHSENGPRNIIYDLRRALRGSAYEILHRPQLGYRIARITE